MFARRLRIVVFGVILAYMVFGPFWYQVLGQRTPLVRPWIMFGGIAIGMADVRFSRMTPDGRLEPVDHYALLGYPDWRKAPLRIRRMRTPEGVATVAAMLCRTLGADADLRARVRFATRHGWRTEIFEADGNLCGRDLAKPGLTEADDELD